MGGPGGLVPAAAVGLGAVRFDGNGGFVGVDLQNLSGPGGFATRQTMTLSWGVDTHITPEFTNQEEVVEAVDKHLRDRGMIEVGERIVMLSGSPMGIPGKTNNLRVHKVKELGES